MRGPYAGARHPAPPVRYLALAAALACAAVPARGQSEWHEVRSDPCRFAVSFPGLVEEHQRDGEVPGATERRFRAVDGGLGFAVYCSTMPPGTLDGLDARPMLRGTVEAMGPVPGSVEAVRTGGHGGLAFVVPVEGGYVYGRTYAVGDVVLMVQVTGPAAASPAPPAAALRFFGSLALTGGERP